MQIYKGHTNDVTQVQVLGKVMFSASRDGSVKSWDVESGEIVTDFKGHTDWIESFKVVHSTLYTGSFDKTAKSWNVDVSFRKTRTAFSLIALLSLL